MIYAALVLFLFSDALWLLYRYHATAGRALLSAFEGRVWVAVQHAMMALVAVLSSLPVIGKSLGQTLATPEFAAALTALVQQVRPEWVGIVGAALALAAIVLRGARS